MIKQVIQEVVLQKKIYESIDYTRNMDAIGKWALVV